jgi:hypothetical protein
MKKDVIKILVAVAVLVVFALFQKTQAIGEDFFVEFSPENPGPNATVSAKANSYSFDINRASITWVVNGQTKLQGTGEKSFSFSTGDIGSITKLSVLITTEKGASFKKDFSFRTADVDILWEALTYTPPWYKGKALPSSESLIKITAVPHFPGAISPAKLIYNWSVAFENKPDISGLAKRSFLLRSANVFNENKISVIVSNYDKSITAEKNISIKISQPKIIFYEENLLEGARFNQTLQRDFQLNDNTINIRAEPFFFSRRNLERLLYEWTMNNQKIVPEEFPNILSLARGEQSGRSSIGLKISNPINILQFAENSLNINF